MERVYLPNDLYLVFFHQRAQNAPYVTGSYGRAFGGSRDLADISIPCYTKQSALNNYKHNRTLEQKETDVWYHSTLDILHKTLQLFKWPCHFMFHKQILVMGGRPDLKFTFLWTRPIIQTKTNIPEDTGL